jgi:hypothetical protein
MPITLGENYNYLSSTGWIWRYNDSYILLHALTGGKPSGSTTTINKIFTPTIYYPNLISFTPSGVAMGNTFRLQIEEATTNVNNISTLNSRGFTLFIKKARDGSDGGCGTLRENPAAAVAVTGNAWGFTFGRNDALCIGMGVSASNATVGLTGHYNFYVVNKEPQNNNELVWRVQFSFGGTNGSQYTGEPQQWDPYEAYINATTSGTLFTNRDFHAFPYSGSADATDNSSPRPHPTDYTA